MFFIKKVYKQLQIDNVSTISSLAVGTTDLQKWKTKSLNAVNSPQVNKERAFHVHLLVESFCIFPRNTFYDKASGSALILICS